MTTSSFEDLLSPGRWLPEVRTAILKLIEEHGVGSEGYDPEAPPLAVFDCDQTLIRHDVGEAVMRHMITHRRLRPSRGFWRQLPEDYSREPISAAFTAMIGRSDSDVWETAAFRRYRAGMFQVYAYLSENDVEAAYTFAASCLRGYSEADAAQIVDDIVTQELSAPIGYEEVVPGAPFPGMTVPTGLRIYQEMIELVDVVKRAGFSPWIVSGSLTQSVQSIAKYLGIAQSNVLGLSLRQNNGVLVEQAIEPITVGEGKLEAFLDAIGRSPVLAIGDSIHDAMLLENCEGLSIVMDRGDQKLRGLADEHKWLCQTPFELIHDDEAPIEYEDEY
ncbi:MAG: haloacid dehalogenase-like hydrolase [Myxococcota bacterium]|nr:haloacid dehalogenase-like hydrolase [Myxococcota bacterium]